MHNYTIEALRNYKTSIIGNDDTTTNFLVDYYDKLSDEEAVFIASKCMHPREARKIILKYEFTNRRMEPKDMDMNTFIKEARKLIYRYQNKAGGYNIEDIDWLLYKPNSDTNRHKRYELKDDEIILENSITLNNLYQEDDKEYVDRLTELLNSLSDNIDVRKYIIETKDDVAWIIIKCKKK